MYDNYNDDTVYRQILHDARNMNILKNHQIDYIHECQNRDYLKSIVQIYVLIFEYVNHIMQDKYIIRNNEGLQSYTTKMGSINLKIRMLNTFTSNEKEFIEHMSISEFLKIITTFNETMGIVHKMMA